MNTADLKTSITGMNDEEAFQLIRSCRFQRRQLPPKKPRKKSSSTAPRKKITTKQAIAKMSKEDRLKLIAELKGMK